MKNSTPKITSTLLWLCALFFSNNISSQVCLDYAAAHAPINLSSQSNFTITGLRIINTNVNAAYPNNAIGDGIFLNDCHNVTISNCIIGPTGGHGIYLQSCSNITITNCIFLDNSAGIIPWGSTGIKINNNQFMNVQNLVPIGGGFGGEGGFIQLRTSSGSGNEIKDNVGENILGFSNPEDLFNVSHSSFDYSSPLIISGNKLRGGGPSASGGGINIADDVGAGTPATANVIAYNNKLVDPGQYGIACFGGYNVLIDANQIYARGQIFNNIGMVAGDGYDPGYCGSMKITNNSVNYTGMWPLGTNNPYIRGFYSGDYACGLNSDSVWLYWGNNFASSIDETILPERLLCPFPVAYLKLDNDFNDYCGSGLNSTAFNNAALACDTYRKAATFDGSGDYLTLPSSPWLKPSTQMITVSAWIKPQAINVLQGFIRSQDSYGWTDGWRAIINNGYFSPLVNTNNGQVYVDCPGLTAGVWNQVCFTYDGKQLKGYVNGVLQSTSSLAGNIIYGTATNLLIGASEGTSDFNGKMAEVKIYNGAKNATEILDDYNNSVGLFDGTIAGNNIGGTYYANGQSKPMYLVNSVLSDSYGDIVAYLPNTSSYSWQVLSGSPSYFYPYNEHAYITIPNGGMVDLRVTATLTCGGSVSRDVVFMGSIYEPFSIKHNPGNNDILVSKITKEPAPSKPQFNMGGSFQLNNASRNQVYTVEVYNLLGQKLKSAIMKDSKLTINIGDVISGVYLIRVTNGKQLLYTQKVVKL